MAGVASVVGWLTLLVSPWIPRGSDLVAGVVVPTGLAVGYVALAMLTPTVDGGGFGTL